MILHNPTFGRWPRGLEYKVITVTDPAYPQMHEERLVALSGKQLLYDPLLKSELPDRLIEVASGLTSPVEFANEHGLLGYSELHDWGFSTKPEMGDNPQSFHAEDPDFVRQAKTPLPKYLEQKFAIDQAEPLQWFLAHARTVKAANDLIVGLKLKDDSLLRKSLEDLPHKQYAALDKVSDSYAFDCAPDYAARDILAATREALIGLINPNIQGLQRKLHVDNFGQLRYSLTFTALIQIVYWHLASRLEDDRLPPRFCQRCGEPFFPADPRQRYCPAPLGKFRSVCGAKAVKDAFEKRWPSGKSGSTRKKHRRIRRPWKKPKGGSK